MYSYNQRKGECSPEKIQQIVENLPPFLVLAILRFPDHSLSVKSSSCFAHLIAKCSQYLEPGWQSVEEILLSEHVISKQLWASLFKRDIGILPDQDVNNKTYYLFCFSVKIIHALHTASQISELLPELDNTDNINIQKLKNAFPKWDDKYGTMSDEYKQMLVGLVMKLASNKQNGLKNEIPLMRIASQTRIVNSLDALLPLIQAVLAVPALDVNIPNQSSFTMLMHAASDKNSTLVKLFLAVGARVNQTNAYKDTALFYVGEPSGDIPLTEGQLESARLLIAAGADPCHQNEHGNNALGNAAINGHPDTAKVLLECGVLPNVANSEGDTPLMIATRKGNIEYIEVLLKHSSEYINHQNNEGDTALIISSRNGYGSHGTRKEESRKMDALLIQYGANPLLANNKGDTAISIQKSKNNSDILYFHKEAIDKDRVITGGVGTIALGVGIGLALGLWKDLPDELDLSAWAITLIAITPVSLFLIGFCIYRKQSQLKYTENTSLLSQPHDADNPNKTGKPAFTIDN